MTDSIRYEPLHREGLKVVIRLLKEAVWTMTGPADWEGALDTLVDGFKSLRIPLDTCGIHLVDSSVVPAAVPCQYVWRDERWRQSVAGADRDVISALWRAGSALYRPDLDSEDAYAQRDCLSKRFGYSVRSSLDVPFTGGLLSLYGSEANSFSERDLEIAKELAEELSPVFHRMDDLKEFEAKEWQLQQAQRLEMVGQLTAGMAHELNNSLTVITGQCELMLLDDLSADIRESIELMAKSAESTRVIMKGLLNFSRGREEGRRLTDLNKLVVESLQLIRRQFKRDNVELREILDSALPPVLAQPDQIQQVLINLAQNSRDALLTGRSGGNIWVRTTSKLGRVTLDVEDDGPGIPEKVRDHIFEPFFTTKEKGKGTGLGLCVCQHIARTHGGYLYADPREYGARIILDLPAADEAGLRAVNN